MPSIWSTRVIEYTIQAGYTAITEKLGVFISQGMSVETRPAKWVVVRVQNMIHIRNGPEVHIPE